MVLPSKHGPIFRKVYLRALGLVWLFPRPKKTRSSPFPSFHPRNATFPKANSAWPAVEMAARHGSFSPRDYLSPMPTTSSYARRCPPTTEILQASTSAPRVEPCFTRGMRAIPGTFSPHICRRSIPLRLHWIEDFALSAMAGQIFRDHTAPIQRILISLRKRERHVNSTGGRLGILPSPCSDHHVLTTVHSVCCWGSIAGKRQRCFPK